MYLKISISSSHHNKTEESKNVKTLFNNISDWSFKVQNKLFRTALMTVHLSSFSEFWQVFIRTRVIEVFQPAERHFKLKPENHQGFHPTMTLRAIGLVPGVALESCVCMCVLCAQEGWTLASL